MSAEARPRRVTLGLLAAPGLAHDLALELARDLSELLPQRFPEVDWHVTVRDEPLAAASTASIDLVDVARRRMLDEGWDLVICLTDQPLLVGRNPVTAHASVTHGVGLVSVPALGAVALESRVRRAVLRLVESLLGERLGRRKRPLRERRRRKRMRRRLEELASPVGHERVGEGTVRFVTAVVRGNVRLLLGMIRANRPWRLIVGLSRALTAAIGAGAFGIVSPGVWSVADGRGWPVLTLLGAAAVLATSTSLIVAHQLWERIRSPETRDRVVLFNLATTVTVVLGVLSLFLALLVISTICTSAVIAPRVMEAQLRHPVSAGTYVRVAMLVTIMATIGGGLGAALESDRAVREAAYGYRPEDD
jgi:hypothetical protein